MLAQARLGDSFMKSLIARKEEKGDLSLDDIGTIFQQVANDFESLNGETESLLQAEILKMADYIQKAKAEIAAISAEQASGDKSIAGATVHLDAVVKSTEKATNEIMDAADAIQLAASKIGGEVEQQIMDASTKIYEACNFQDVTGQQINRVISLISYLDERLQSLTDIFHKGVLPSISQASKQPETSAGEDIDPESLKNGPQLEAPSQDDIDALFDSIDTAKVN